MMSPDTYEGQLQRQVMERRQRLFGPVVKPAEKLTPQKSGPKKPLVTKDDVIALNRKRPDLTASELAEELGCMPEYVRTTGKRNGLTFPQGKSGPRMPASTGVTLRKRSMRAALTSVQFLREAIQRGDPMLHLMERCDDLEFDLREALGRE